ncbi:hypothetical protein FHX59_003533 [Paraburkholderia silvatlantica]|uniref:Uncharacterized protein n=1 Tax=Paraburkholderia silvatlantica TaxID=321895 RepID=A0A2U1A8J0_9BURK|nr:hypothetical protein [Paraburkholderia silvatlantica]PVY29197.1 hypothetical protein C7411_115116 [Paraburkholderia silvatlantica]PXW36672.1 hypothetical protein C7413_114116 [Paraburkholderia silvatlantica]PYE22156.1 hypothetical protein C7410_11189 [Paraburkholderia silvatlantica]TDQ99060.1 hypothetical protein C7412_104277 [Paraburkholderia silvatlantica]
MTNETETMPAPDLDCVLREQELRSVDGRRRPPVRRDAIAKNKGTAAMIGRATHARNVWQPYY